MAEKLEDLNLPVSVVWKLIKEALPEGVSVAKEARVGLAKVASVFILYVTSASTNVAKKAGRKTLAASDVLDAMEDIEFEKYVEPLKLSLETYKNSLRAKKEAAAIRKKDEEKNNSVADNIDDSNPPDLDPPIEEVELE